MAEVAQVVPMDSPASMELAAAKLDARLPRDREALLERFALAERLGDDRALEWVLTEQMLPTLPYSVRSRAELVLGRVALQRGDLERANQHLLAVKPTDKVAYAEARLLLGDIFQERGKLKSAVVAYREAWNAGLTEGLFEIAEIYAEIERYDNADTYFSLIPPGDPLWGEAQVRRAELGFERRTSAEILGFLVAAEVQGGFQAIEGPLIEAWARRALCWDEHADAIEEQAMARVEEALSWLADRTEVDLLGQPLWSPQETWETLGTGPLPDWWFAQILQRHDLRPLIARLERIDSVPGAGPVLAERRARTIEQLGMALASAYQQAEDRLERLLAAEPHPWTVDPRYALFCGPRRHRLVWPFNGEVWRDEPTFEVSVPSRCPLEDLCICW